MNLEVDEEKKAEIANVITSPDSPVGIDAKKTHIIIINKPVSYTHLTLPTICSV